MPKHPSTAAKRKMKANYRKAAHAAKRSRPTDFSCHTTRTLQAGLIGYIVTYQNKQERRALTEAYRLLNDTLKEQEVKSSDDNQKQAPVERGDSIGQESKSEASSSQSTTPDVDDDDILAQLERENQQPSTDAAVTTDDGQASSRYVFNVVKTGVTNRMFITHNQPSTTTPTQLSHHLYARLLDGQAHSRSLLRLMPVEATCHADLDSLKRLLCQLWSNFIGKEQADNKPTYRAQPNTLSDSRPTFLIEVKIAAFNLLKREQLIEQLAAVVSQSSPNWRVCPTNPSVVIFVTIMRNVGCLSLLEHYAKYRRYNVSELLLSTSPQVVDQPAKAGEEYSGEGDKPVGDNTSDNVQQQKSAD